MEDAGPSSGHAANARPQVVLASTSEAGRSTELVEILQRHGLSAQHRQYSDGASLLSLAQSCDVLLLERQERGDANWFALRMVVEINNRPPVIMVSDSSDSVDRIVGLELGADDYVDGSFTDRELTARVRAVLRRCARRRTEPAPVGASISAPAGEVGEPIHQRGTACFGDWVVNFDARTICRAGGARVKVSGNDQRLLGALMRSAQQVMDRDTLAKTMHGNSAEVRVRTVDVSISRMRSKLDHHNQEVIRTVRSRGYLFLPKVTWT